MICSSYRSANSRMGVGCCRSVVVRTLFTILVFCDCIPGRLNWICFYYLILICFCLHCSCCISHQISKARGSISDMTLVNLHLSAVVRWWFLFLTIINIFFWAKSVSFQWHVLRHICMLFVTDVNVTGVHHVWSILTYFMDLASFLHSHSFSFISAFVDQVGS